MIYFGAVAVIFGAYMMWREYAVFLDKELLWCRTFLRALSDYREKIKCYMDTPSSWACGYNDRYLSECGFLGRLMDGDNFSDAYRGSCGKLILTDTTEDTLNSCFERLGDGYLDTELEVIEQALEKLSREEGRISEDLLKRRKAAGAVLGAFASGIIILII